MPAAANLHFHPADRFRIQFQHGGELPNGQSKGPSGFPELGRGQRRLSSSGGRRLDGGVLCVEQAPRQRSARRNRSRAGSQAL
jgi:hypothetical protein